MQGLILIRLNQAREALDEAKALIEADMDRTFVMNNLYYAFYYPMLALLYEGRVPTSMQSVTLGLFEKKFIETGVLERRLGEALRRAFELRPQCGNGICEPITNDELTSLLSLAGEFIIAADSYFHQKQ